MFTLADLVPVPVDLALKHPITGEALGVSVKVVGQDSDEYGLSLIDQYMKNHGTDQVPTATDLQAASNTLLASCIVGWSSDEFFGVPWSKEAALKAVATSGAGFMREQIKAFVDIKANFFR